MIANKKNLPAAPAQQQQGGELTRYTPEDIDVIRNHVASPDFTDRELAYCLKVARARGLDPLQKQVYFTKRKKKNANGDWVAAVTVEPTIDGFRAMAERTNELQGYDGPFWCGEDGEWHDVWLGKAPPIAAKITVYRKGKEHGFTAVARFAAYVQTDREGNPNHMWAKMGDNQLAKCAEALALRKAFPSQLGAFYTREEMGQSDAPDRFENLPKEDKPAARALPPKNTKKRAAPEVKIPDVVEAIPVEMGKALPVLKDLTGVPLEAMDDEDLELVISTFAEARQRPQASEVARKWALAIEANATQILRDRNEANPPDDDGQGADERDDDPDNVDDAQEANR